MINVNINKKSESLPEGMTVQELLEKKGMKKAAVWIDGKQLLRADYEDYIIREGDDIKLLRIMAGG